MFIPAQWAINGNIFWCSHVLLQVKDLPDYIRKSTRCKLWGYLMRIKNEPTIFENFKTIGSQTNLLDQAEFNSDQRRRVCDTNPALDEVKNAHMLSNLVIQMRIDVCTANDTF